MADFDGKGRANFYAHQHPVEVPSLHYQTLPNREQVPLNFIGRKTLRAPTSSESMFCPQPLDGVWRAEKAIPIMRTLPITPRFQ